jgi:hypothetical protein
VRRGLVGILLGLVIYPTAVNNGDSYMSLAHIKKNFLHEVSRRSNKDG